MQVAAAIAGLAGLSSLVSSTNKSRRGLTVSALLLVLMGGQAWSLIGLRGTDNLYLGPQVGQEEEKGEKRKSERSDLCKTLELERRPPTPDVSVDAQAKCSIDLTPSRPGATRRFPLEPPTPTAQAEAACGAGERPTGFFECRGDRLGGVGPIIGSIRFLSSVEAGTEVWVHTNGADGRYGCFPAHVVRVAVVRY